MAILAASLFLVAATERDTCPYQATAAVAPQGHRRAVAPAPSTPGVFPPTVNFIDADLFAKMRKDGIVPRRCRAMKSFSAASRSI
jgi:hypothetical protein